MLMSYHWPGNVRELENMIERAVIMSNSSVINAVDLPPSLQTAAATGTQTTAPGLPIVPGSSASLQELTDAFEKEVITEALKRTKGNASAAALALGTTLRKLNYRIRRLKLSPHQFR